MNDFNYDILQKKRIARGAVHRKCGSKSKMCRLPHENLTPKQLKGLNGQVMQYEMNEPKKWDNFKELPVDLQKEYVQNIIKEYGCSCTELSEMFGRCARTVNNYFKDHDFGINFTRGGKRSPSDKERFRAFIRGETVQAERDAHKVYSEQKTLTAQEPIFNSTDGTSSSESSRNEDIVSCYTQESMKMNRFSMTFVGAMDAHMLSNSIAHIVRNGARCKVHIECEVFEQS